MSAPHGLDKMMVLTKQTLNLNNPSLDKVVLGHQNTKSLTSIMNDENKKTTRYIDEVSPVGKKTTFTAGGKTFTVSRGLIVKES